MYFLVWWYTTGLTELITRLSNHAHDLARSLHLKTLVKYLFVPMFGYYDIGSRVISFCVRCVQLIVLLIYTILYLLFESVVLVVWVAIPPVIFYNLIYQLIGLWNQK